MSVGSDNKKLSIPPAVVPGISVDPPTPELIAKSSLPRKRVQSNYKRSGAQIADMIAQAPQVTTQTYISSGCRLLQCDTECKNKWRCTQHSFELPQSFRSAWANLTERFENKRLLINGQINILFNMQSVNQESGQLSVNFKAPSRVTLNIRNSN